MKIAVFLVAVGYATVVVAQDAFVALGVVPDVLDETPPARVRVTYSNGVSVDVGNVLALSQVQIVPEKIRWDAENDALYLLSLSDPDAFRNQNSTSREYLHFMVGNIPGNNIGGGNILFAYIPPAPPEGTGYHRYVWVVYKQPGRIEYNMQTELPQGREYFSIREYAKNRNLGKPVFGNFFRAQFGSNVPSSTSAPSSAAGISSQTFLNFCLLFFPVILFFH